MKQSIKKVKAIKDLSGENLPIEKMDILFIGDNYVIAKYKGYGFMNKYASYDGYTVEFE